MPFSWAKPPLFAAIEQYLNSDEARALDALRQIRVPKGRSGFTELWDMAAFRGANAPDGRRMKGLLDEFRANWCGYVWTGESWSEPDVSSGTNVGVWQSYAGRVEAITRQALRTALEMSLGIDADELVPGMAARHWPLDMYWVRGQNWFEAWVTWREHDRPSGAGHVNVFFSTPSDGSLVLDSPIDNSRLDTGRSYDPDVRSTREPGTGEERRAGMAVVTHRSNKVDYWQSPRVRRIEDGLEVPRWVSARILGQGEIVVVAPSVADGGVLARPRPDDREA
jgi:hypothetical protein